MTSSPFESILSFSESFTVRWAICSSHATSLSGGIPLTGRTGCPYTPLPLKKIQLWNRCLILLVLLLLGLLVTVLHIDDKQRYAMREAGPTLAIMCCLGTRHFRTGCSEKMSIVGGKSLWLGNDVSGSCLLIFVDASLWRLSSLSVT